MKLPCLLLTGIIACLALAEETKDAPAPTEDRVGFPKGYQDSFQVLRTVPHEKEHKIVTIYGNTVAASVTTAAQLPYPYGSVIVMETATTATDEAGKPKLDTKGAPIKTQVTGMHVMRREKDFGTAYGTNRSGEWEYAEYHADGTYITPPAKSASCSACHVKAGKEKDFVYQARLGGAVGK